MRKLCICKRMYFVREVDLVSVKNLGKVSNEKTYGGLQSVPSPFRHT